MFARRERRRRLVLDRLRLRDRGTGRRLAAHRAARLLDHHIVRQVRRRFLGQVEQRAVDDELAVDRQCATRPSFATVALPDSDSLRSGAANSSSLSATMLAVRSGASPSRRTRPSARSVPSPPWDSTCWNSTRFSDSFTRTMPSFSCTPADQRRGQVVTRQHPRQVRLHRRAGDRQLQRRAPAEQVARPEQVAGRLQRRDVGVDATRQRAVVDHAEHPVAQRERHGDVRVERADPPPSRAPSR